MRRRRNEAPPAASPPFDAAFRALLPALLGQTAQFRGARDQAQRARRAVLSQSGTFVGHRPYARGDDLRRLDWAAYARTGALFTKQLEEEERRTAAVLLDLSASLLVGAVPRRLAMLRLAAVVGGLALAHLDGLVVVAPGAGPLALANFTGIGQLAALLQHLEALPVATAGPEQAVELLLRRGLPGRVHWLGDFAVPAAHELPLAALRRRGVRVTAWRRCPRTASRRAAASCASSIRRRSAKCRCRSMARSPQPWRTNSSCWRASRTSCSRKRARRWCVGR
jgi:uncharacterized protein (DUF58 family)